MLEISDNDLNKFFELKILTLLQDKKDEGVEAADIMVYWRWDPRHIEMVQKILKKFENGSGLANKPYANEPNLYCITGDGKKRLDRIIGNYNDRLERETIGLIYHSLISLWHLRDKEGHEVELHSKEVLRSMDLPKTIQDKEDLTRIIQNIVRDSVSTSVSVKRERKEKLTA